MNIQDPISDMINRISNNQKIKKKKVIMFYSKFKSSISKILKEEGYIEDYNIINKKNKKKILEIKLKYFKKKSVIHNIKRISKPSLRVYKNKKNLPKIISGFGIAIISTSKGVMTDHKARKYGLGGEIICYVS
ncbi:30S ribosomal protein S8 [Candidatus Annandia adelgestsuga]|uniref:Small ribosomal subunit protein uS8 n=1 Tax=Candidatus Annandia adelgestsuga TaxID=1302411 RepID=A0A3S9J777_9ENTR|nr:30S ribosomal protein S8 [Candidatus Annandia adelgestsuga]AZP36208.1 30S ribosomal protein S8 [Candidatus Annandia adelgestsuga]